MIENERNWVERVGIASAITLNEAGTTKVVAPSGLISSPATFRGFRRIFPGGRTAGSDPGLSFPEVAEKKEAEEEEAKVASVTSASSGENFPEAHPKGLNYFSRKTILSFIIIPQSLMNSDTEFGVPRAIQRDGRRGGGGESEKRSVKISKKKKRKNTRLMLPLRKTCRVYLREEKVRRAVLADKYPTNGT